MNFKTSKVIHQKRVLFGLATIQKLRNGTTRFNFSMARLSAAVAVLFLLAWFSLFSAAFIHFKYRRGFEEASYVETLLLPFTHESFQKKRGEYYLKTAFEAMDASDFKSALNLLRNGLIRSPENIKGRYALSEFYEFLINRPKLAFDLLCDGIPFLSGKPEQEQKEYIQYLFAVGSRNQLDDALIEAGYTITAEIGDQLPAALQALVWYQIASGFRNKGNTKQSKVIIEKHQLNRFSEGLVLQAQLLWDMGEEDLSIRLLEERIAQYKENRPIYEKLIALLNDKQRTDKARQYAILYQLEHPQVFQSHLARLKHYYEYRAEDHHSINKFIDEYLSLFKENGSAIQQLAIITSKYGDVVQTQNVLNVALSETGNLPNLLADFILTESIIRSKDYDQAISKLNEIQDRFKGGKPINPDSQSILLSLKTAAYHGKGLEAEANQALNELLKSPVIKIDRYLAVAYLFLEVDAPAIAGRIMDACQETQVYNANVMEALIAVQLKSGNADKLSSILNEAINTRRLPNRLLVESYHLLSSDSNMHVKDRALVMDKIQNCFSTDYLFKDDSA